THSTEIVPLLVLSHYWYGADVRAPQPWDFKRPRWYLNLIPTFAFGIPLSKSPIENFFIGSQWQPVPGVGMMLGAHVGKVNALRSGFAVGGSTPMPADGFRIGDAVEQRFKSGFYFGVTISDTVFIKLLLALAGGAR